MAKSYLDKDGLLYFLQKIRPDATPLMDGTATTGTAKRFALQDHVHPTDTSLAPKASPALTGTPTAPTATTGTSTTQIATTEFVANTVGAMTSGVSDVKVDGTSVVTSGVANINTFTAASGSTSGTKGLVPPPPSGADSDLRVLTAAGDFSQFSVDTATSGGKVYVRLKSNLNGSATTHMSTDEIPTATTSNNGVMSASDKTKLNKLVFDGNNLIDSSILPSYVDDVIEAYPVSGATALSSGWLSATSGGSALTPETGKIYVLMTDSGDYAANTQFRWGGTAYVKLADGGVSSITNGEIDIIVAS